MKLRKQSADSKNALRVPTPELSDKAIRTLEISLRFQIGPGNESAKRGNVMSIHDNFLPELVVDRGRGVLADNTTRLQRLAGQTTLGLNTSISPAGWENLGEALVPQGKRISKHLQ